MHYCVAKTFLSLYIQTKFLITANVWGIEIGAKLLYLRH